MENDVFDPEFVKELNFVIELQEAMMSITLENIESIFNHIQLYYDRIIKEENNHKIHKNEAEFLKFISSTILTVAHYRPKQLTPLSQLAGKLFEKYANLKERLLQVPLTVVSSQWHIAFLFECFINHVITEDEAYEILFKYKYHYSSMHGTIYLIFQYFHQIIRKKDPQFYEDSFNYLIKNQRRYDINVSPEFLQIRKSKIGDLNNIDENEFEYDLLEEEKFNDTIRNWFPKGSIERVIKDDDFEAFKEITANYSEFSLNDVFEIKSIFCYPEILKHRTNYLSLAAFFGSVKIFNYLLELGAIQNPLFEINRKPLINYAIAGGNVDIIKKCELDQDNEIEIENSIDSSVEYFRFSLFQWIYDTKLESFQKYTQIQTNENRQLLMFSPMKISFPITAAKVNNLKMLLFLLDNEDGSCDINQMDNFGWTPLHFAAKFRNIEAIKVILNCKLLNLKPKSYDFIVFPFSHAFFLLLDAVFFFLFCF